jgi:hypothetical protein
MYGNKKNKNLGVPLRVGLSAVVPLKSSGSYFAPIPHASNPQPQSNSSSIIKVAKCSLSKKLFTLILTSLIFTTQLSAQIQDTIPKTNPKHRNIKYRLP